MKVKIIKIYNILLNLNYFKNILYFLNNILAIIKIKIEFYLPARHKLIKYSVVNKSNIQYCFIIPFILNSLGKEIPVLPLGEGGSEPIIKLFTGIFLLSILALLSLINILFYLASIHIINHSIRNKDSFLKKYESKIPYLTKVINFYEKTSIYFIIFEFIFCIFCFIVLIYCSYIIIF